MRDIHSCLTCLLMNIVDWIQTQTEVKALSQSMHAAHSRVLVQMCPPGILQRPGDVTDFYCWVHCILWLSSVWSRFYEWRQAMSVELSRLVPGAWCCEDWVEALLEAVPDPTMGCLYTAVLLLWGGLGSGDTAERKPWRSVSRTLQQSEGLKIVTSISETSSLLILVGFYFLGSLEWSFLQFSSGFYSWCYLVNKPWRQGAHFFLYQQNFLVTANPLHLYTSGERRILAWFCLDWWWKEKKRFLGHGYFLETENTTSKSYIPKRAGRRDLLGVLNLPCCKVSQVSSNHLCFDLN